MKTTSRTILVTSRSFGSGDQDITRVLSASGYSITRRGPEHRIEDLEPVLASAVAWIAGTGPVDDARLALAPNLRVLARYGVGVDNVDLASAAARSVVVTNTPGANSAAVAEHTMALLLSSLRGVAVADRRVRKGEWGASLSRELSSLTVGVVGLGRIGRGVIDRLAGFGATVLGVDPFAEITDPVFDRVGRRSVADLAEQCDIVSLHAPGGAAIIDREWLAASKRPVGIINTARAELVDEDALVRALHSGRAQFYAADALSAEHRRDYSSPLLADELADRVLVTPHLAAQTREAVDRMGRMVVKNVVAALSGDTPPNVVRMPA